MFHSRFRISHPLSLTLASLWFVAIALMQLTTSNTVAAQPAGYNYDEALVPAYELPDPLTFNDGTPVQTAEEWQRRRAELLETFRSEMFGRAPELDLPLNIKVVEDNRDLHDGSVRRRQIEVRIGQPDRALTVHLLVYTPAKATAPVPTFLGLNFNGNHTVEADPAIRITDAWVHDDSRSKSDKNTATEAGRGTAAHRWPIAEVVGSDFGLATAYYGEIDPDFDDGFANGIHGLVETPSPTRPADAWGSIAAWSWGLSRLLDVLLTLDDVDGERVVVVGHSRLGKTALWAGAEDPRFAMVISNNSGCGGAAISRRHFGETVQRINTVFPHWFCDAYSKYNEAEDQASFDQHELIALMAPRPVYITSATEDQWADPRGEFLSSVGAAPVYRLLGTEGIATETWPNAGEPIHSTIGYHLRSGPHEILLEDWKEFMKHAEQHLGRR